MTFNIDGQPLIPVYDEEEDILYLWVDERRVAVTHETEAGHLVQLDPISHEFIGVGIMDYRACWEGKRIELEIPQIEHRVLEPA